GELMGDGVEVGRVRVPAEALSDLAAVLLPALDEERRDAVAPVVVAPADVDGRALAPRRADRAHELLGLEVVGRADLEDEGVVGELPDPRRRRRGGHLAYGARNADRLRCGDRRPARNGPDDQVDLVDVGELGRGLDGGWDLRLVVLRVDDLDRVLVRESELCQRLIDVRGRELRGG